MAAAGPDQDRAAADPVDPADTARRGGQSLDLLVVD
jgi:hypothetical protein